MSWSCPDCGFESNEDTVIQCVACGKTRMPRTVVLAGESAYKLSMNISTTCSQALLKDVGGEDSRYASSPQFEIVRDDTEGCWWIRHDESATNPTCVNGEPVTEPHRLDTGDVISIGPEKMKLCVTLEY